MCLIASAYESRQQRKAADKAARQARAASISAQNMAESERNAAAAQEAAEAQVADGGSELDLAKRRRGVGSTYLNQTLGE